MRPEDLKPIQGAAAAALGAWLKVLLEYRITHGPIFRRILHDRLLEPLKDSAVRTIIQRRTLMSEQALGKLSAHSLRSGFVTEAARFGISLGQTMAMTGHKSVQTVMGYYQSGELSASKRRASLTRRVETQVSPPQLLPFRLTLVTRSQTCSALGKTQPNPACWPAPRATLACLRRGRGQHARR